MVRVRIAPSPTGIPHIGNTRTALFNYLFAKHHKGAFLLRIEDTDRSRLVPESEDAIREILKWLGLDWDEEYKQSQRLDIYKKHAEELLAKGLAYKEKDAIRFKMPEVGETSWDDLIGEKHISFKNESQEDFVIIKSDGFPTYNFANVVDDHLMEISHVIRGEEFISSTPKHIRLYKSFGWGHPFFAHLPIVLGPDKTKLSKRHGAKSVLDYRDEGYLKEAILNYMVLLGWRFAGAVNDGEGAPHVFPEREIMSLDFMINFFDLKDVNTASPIFDIKKLEWMNGVYIRKSQISNLRSQILDRNKKLKNADSLLLDKLIHLAQTRMKTLNDFTILTSHFFEEPKIILNQKEKMIAEQLIKYLSTIEQWSNETILEAMKYLMSRENISMSVIYKILTGKDRGLPLPQSLEILGKEKVLERLRKAERD